MAANAVSPPPLTASTSSSSSKTLCFAKNTVLLSPASSSFSRAVGGSRLSSRTIKGRRRTLESGKGFGVVKCMASGAPPLLPKALLFDCDGVLVDTEKDGHRISFNDTFAEVLSLSLSLLFSWEYGLLWFDNWYLFMFLLLLLTGLIKPNRMSNEGISFLLELMPL